MINQTATHRNVGISSEARGTTTPGRFVMACMEELRPLWVTGLALLVFVPAKYLLTPTNASYNTIPHLVLGSIFPALALLVCALPRWAGAGMSRAIQSLLAVLSLVVILAVIAYSLRHGFSSYPFILAVLQLAVVLALSHFGAYWDSLRGRSAAADPPVPRVGAEIRATPAVARTGGGPTLVGFLVSVAAWAVTFQFLQGEIYWWGQGAFTWTAGTGFEEWVILSVYTIPVLVLSLVLVVAGVFSADPAKVDGKRPLRVRAARTAANLLGIVVLGLASFRSSQFADDFPDGFNGSFMGYFHWTPLVGAVDCVRQGGWLLWDFPSQYGVLNMWLLGHLPARSPWQAVYLGNSAIIFGSLVFLFLVLRALGRGLVNWCFALATALGTGILLPGIPLTLTGPQNFPHNGPLRFLGVYALLAVLFWDFRRWPRHRKSRLALWLGSVVWLSGCLWSFDSAIMCTVVWAPAYTLLAWRDAVTRLPPGHGVKARLRHVLRWLPLPVLLLVLAVAALAGYYRAVLGQGPDGFAFVDIAFAWAGKYSGWSMDRVGTWIVFLVACAAGTAVIHLIRTSQVAGLGLAWGIWGGLWASFSYYMSHNDRFSFTCLAPMACTVMALLIHLLARAHPCPRLTALVKMSLVPVFTVLLAAAFGRAEVIPPAVRAFRVGYGPLEAALPAMDESALELLKATPIEEGASVLFWDDPPRLAAHRDREAARAGRARPARDWIPLLPVEVAADVLPEERLGVYLRRWVSRVHSGGYLLFAKNRPALWTPDREWFFREISATHECTKVGDNEGYELMRFELKAPYRH